ncbi:MAG: Hpt domain-containing protein [Roseovarius sp.]
MIDWTRITLLRQEIGPADFEEVVEIFLEEVETELAALHANATPDTLEARLHFLKGSALNLGFTDFSELCRKGEITAARGAVATVDIAPIVDSYSRSKSEFLRDLPRITSD